MVKLSEAFEARKKRFAKFPSQYGLVPEKGMAVTLHIGSDSYPGTIIDLKVSKDGIVSTIMFQEDTAKIVEPDPKRPYAHSGEEKYEYERNPNAPIKTARLRKNGGYYVDDHRILTVGIRRKYRDPSF